MDVLLPRTGLVLSGLCLAAYPALRPYAPDTGAAGARALAGSSWTLAHACAMAGFVLLALALRGLAGQGWRVVRRLETTTWLAVALVLPYYGAEAFGLHEVGRYAVATGDPAVLVGAEAFRTAALPATTFLVGLVLLALVGLGIARWAWPEGGTAARAGVVLLGLGLVTFVPQFFAPPGVRIAHGVVLGLGLVLLGATIPRVPAGAPGTMTA